MASPESAIFYRSPAWKALRRSCLERDHYQCIVPGCSRRATHADHIDTRPKSASLTPFDRLGNLRSLCADHDNQRKERANGTRRGHGFVVMGCDRDGWPLDPGHPLRAPK